jgi:4-amino-4-deoxy-L-arabinose transferase-like glycosyltransferase
VLCALTILVHLAISRRLGLLFSLRFLYGLVVYMLLVGTWLVLVETRFPGFLAFYVYKEHVLRVAGDEHWEVFYWYVPWMLVGFLPWTPAWLAALPAIARRVRESSRSGQAVRFAVVWAAAVLVFFSVPRGKLVPYILPLFPALAIQLGDALSRWIAEEDEVRGVRFAFLLVGLGVLLAAAGLPIGRHLSPVLVPQGRVAWSVVLGLGSAVLVIALHRRRSAAPVLAVAGVVGLLECAAVVIAAPIIHPLTTMPIIEILRERLTPEDGFAAYGGYFPNVPFYLRRVPYFVFGNRELDFGVSLEGNGPWVVDDLRQLHARLGHRRIFFLLRTRERDLQTLLALPGTATLLHRGRSSSLVEYQP